MEGGPGPSRGGAHSLWAALQQLLEQRVGLSAQGDRGAQLRHPPRVHHQHAVRVQDRVEPAWEGVVNTGMEACTLQKAGLLSLHPCWTAPPAPQASAPGLCARGGAARSLRPCATRGLVGAYRVRS